MDEETRDAIEGLVARVLELEEVQGAHRALISRHQSALKTVAQIMEDERGVHPVGPSPDRST